MCKSTKIFMALTVVTGMLSASSAVVKDTRNGIYWEDTPASAKSSEDWKDARRRCERLQLDGMTGWRLPTFEELLSIVDYAKSRPAVIAPFEYTAEESYWSATPFSANFDRAWTIDFRTGETYYSYKRTNHAVRCVKEIVEPRGGAK